jgi:5-methylcytosine-specific restriction endonuclease McrA
MIVTKTDHRERNFCSDDCVNSFNSDRMKGENNPRYVDGKSRGKKYNSDWVKVKEKIMERDSNECSICGCIKNLHGHHIIPVREFVNEEDAHYKENAVILCASCHRNVEYGNKSIPDEKVEKDNLEVFDGEYI